MVGVGGHYNFAVKALKKGNGEFTISYGRPWEKNVKATGKDLISFMIHVI